MRGATAEERGRSSSLLAFWVTVISAQAPVSIR
jgi:hypothetical protein